MLKKLATTKECLDYLEKISPEVKIKLGLNHIKEFGDRLGLLNPDPFVFTVAGTNGKGSTVAILESILLAGGYKTGSYTSPHVYSFNDRIKINGTPVADQELCQAFCKVLEAQENSKLTYFETITMVAFCCFTQHDLDAIIIEIGMGGRLDACNSIDPDISVITSIALDHQQFLGSTRNKIAKEKAGIMRANKPLVYGDATIYPSITEKSKKLNSCIYSIGDSFNFQRNDNSWSWSGVAKNKNITISDLPFPKDLILKNAATALQALSLFDRKISNDAVVNGLQHVELEGRFQLCNVRMNNKNIEFILDVSHNPAAVDCFLENIKRYSKNRKHHIIFAVFADKNYKQMLKKLLPVAKDFFITQVESPRALPVEDITGYLSHLGVKSYACQNPKQALEQALALTKDIQSIIVIGSFLLIEDIACLLKNR